MSIQATKISKISSEKYENMRKVRIKLARLFKCIVSFENYFFIFV